MCNYISFLVNPFDENDIRVGGFMTVHYRTRQICDLPSGWGYDGEWKPGARKPVIFCSDNDWTEEKRKIYGPVGRRRPRSAEMIADYMLSSFKNFKEFERWAICHDGIPSEVIQDRIYPYGLAWNAVGHNSIQYSSARVLLAGNQSTQRHVYQDHLHTGVSVTIGGERTIQIVPPGGIALGRHQSVQIVRTTDENIEHIPPGTVTRLVGMQHSNQLGFLVRDPLEGRRIIHMESGGMKVEKMTRPEIIETVKEAIRVLNGPIFEAVALSIKKTFAETPFDMLRMVGAENK